MPAFALAAVLVALVYGTQAAPVSVFSSTGHGSTMVPSPTPSPPLSVGNIYVASSAVISSLSTTSTSTSSALVTATHAIKEAMLGSSDDKLLVEWLGVLSAPDSETASSATSSLHSPVSTISTSITTANPTETITAVASPAFSSSATTSAVHSQVETVEPKAEQFDLDDGLLRGVFGAFSVTGSGSLVPSASSSTPHSPISATSIPVSSSATPASLIKRATPTPTWDITAQKFNANDHLFDGFFGALSIDASEPVKDEKSSWTSTRASASASTLEQVSETTTIITVTVTGTSAATSSAA